MNVLLNVLLIFAFLNIMFYMKIINVTDGQYLKNKLILFLVVFCFQFIIDITSTINKKRPVIIKEIITNCAMTTLYVILGYSVYTDLNNMGMIQEHFSFGPKLSNTFVCTVITLTLTFFKTIELLSASR